ncbi:MAG TPA: hypothetical protein VFM15_09625 [Gammaproteobacteria bacterium]|nr:hypothetical protein [Gammaproteobacteria bacterium]
MPLVIALVIVLCAALLGVQWLRMNRRRRVQGRQIAMESLWQAWVGADSLSGSARDERETLLAQVDAENRESVHRSLLDFELGLQSETSPMIALRKELMDSMDRRLLNLEILQLPDEVRQRLRAQSSEMMQSDALAHAYIAANDLRMAILREYAAQRFNDCIAGDWFDVYRKASRLKQRSARNFIQRTLAGSQSSVDDARYQTMSLVDHEIRARLLKVPAGARFPGFDAGPDTDPAG